MVHVNGQEPVIKLWNDLCNYDKANGAAEDGSEIGEGLNLINRTINYPFRKAINDVLFHNLSVDGVTQR